MALGSPKRCQNAQIRQFTPLNPAAFLTGEVRTPVSVGIQYALTCVARPAHTPAVMPEQVELVAPDCFGLREIADCIVTVQGHSTET